MVELIRGLSAERVAANLERVRGEISASGRDPSEVEILAATKYVPLGELPVLAEAGVRLVGENRAQDLVAKVTAHPGLFTWDFIGHLQSRKVSVVLPHVRYIHSVASDSALTQLERHGGPDTRILVEVNVAGEPGKSGLEPEELEGFLARCPVTVVGLMTCESWPGATACPSSRWAPVRTTGWPCRRARPSSGSARRSITRGIRRAGPRRPGTLAPSVRPGVIIPGRETASARETPNAHGLQRYMAPRARLLRAG
jgi:uncharacterized pyridoxal phosphate-containing UPF0001 family protein